MEHEDRHLLLATHRGHEASARLLWARHGPRLLAHARSILRDAGTADDAVQAVMCRLLELPRSRLAAVEDVPAFLAAATRREALNHLRTARREAARRRARPRGEFVDAAGAALGPEMDRALEALPRRLREVVVLKHVSDLTFDQIALALATNRNTIASRYRTAVATLKEMLEGPVARGAAHA